MSDRFSIIRLKETPSTMDAAREELARSQYARVAVFTDLQTQGRGRQGRAWQMRPGNLALSLGLVLPSNIALYQLGFVFGLSVHQALQPLLSVPLKLKWPNDLMIHQAKLGGILLENEHVGQQCRVVIGCGMNVLWAPEGLPYPTTALQEHVQAVINLEALIGSIIDCFSTLLTQWQKEGFSTLRTQWLPVSYRLGEEIQVKVDEKTCYSGIFQEIDAEGAMILQQGEQARRILVGDVT